MDTHNDNLDAVMFDQFAADKGLDTPTKTAKEDYDAFMATLQAFLDEAKGDRGHALVKGIEACIYAAEATMARAKSRGYSEEQLRELVIMIRVRSTQKLFDLAHLSD